MYFSQILCFAVSTAFVAFVFVCSLASLGVFKEVGAIFDEFATMFQSPNKQRICNNLTVQTGKISSKPMAWLCSLRETCGNGAKGLKGGSYKMLLYITSCSNVRISGLSKE